MTTRASSPEGDDIYHETAADQSSLSPQVSSPTLSQSSDDLDALPSFHFPTLKLDGSLDALHLARFPPRRFSTPPAALSTLGAKAFMARRDYAESLSALADSQYDLVQHDELSDHDNDGDTASIASTTSEHSEDDGELIDAEIPSSTRVIDDDEAALDELMDSIGDTLETPRQSTVATFRPQLTDNLNRTVSTTCIWGDSADEEDELIKKTNTKNGANIHGDMELSKSAERNVQNSSFPSLKAILTALVLLLFAGTQLFRHITASTVLSEHADKKQALTISLGSVSNMSDVAKIFVLDHLLPAPELRKGDLWGMTYHTYQSQQDVRFQTFSPNHFVVSVPAKSLFFAPRLEVVNVRRAGMHSVSSNWTELVPGVYHIFFDVEQAYGLITVDMEIKHSIPKSKASHYFGTRMLQRHTYEKATTDLSKTVGKRGLVARKTAQTITGKLQHRLTEGIATTHNITQQLAIYISHDLQAVVNETMTILTRAQQVGKDLIVAEKKDLIRMSESIKHAVTDHTTKAFIPTRKMIKARLRVAIDHAVGLRNSVQHALQRKPDHKLPSQRTRSNKFAGRKIEHSIARATRKVEREMKKTAKTAVREVKQKKRSATSMTTEQVGPEMIEV